MMRAAPQNRHAGTSFGKMSSTVGTGMTGDRSKDTVWSDDVLRDQMAMYLSPQLLEEGVPTNLMSRHLVSQRVYSANLAPVIEVVDKYMSSEDATYDSESVYQLLRSSGALFREAVSSVEVIDTTGPEVMSRPVLRSQDHYVPLAALGERFFPIKPLFTQKGAVLKLNADYLVVGSLDNTKCLGVSTGTYGQSIKIEMATDCKPRRRNVTALETPIPSATFNKDYSEFRTGHVTKLETLVSSLGFRRGTEQQNELRSLRQAVKEIGGSSQLCRYVRAYATILAMDHTSTAHITATCAYNVVLCEYTLENINQVCKSLLATGGTALNCCGMDKRQRAAALTMCLEFPSAEIKAGDRYMTFGSYKIQPETRKTIYMFHDDPTVEKGVDTEEVRMDAVTADEIYGALLVHSSLLHATKELVDSVPLAACLLMAGDMPSFSLPMSQGYLDLVAPAILAGPSVVSVPPRRPTSYLLLGALAVTRQMVMMVQDIASYGDPQLVGNVSTHLSNNRSLRMQLYSYFAELRFSEAFALTTIVDPLNITENSSWKAVAELPYIDFAWSSIKKGKSLKGSMSSFFDRGLWEDADRIEGLSKEDAARAKSTFYVNGLLGTAKVRGTSVVDKRAQVGPRYAALAPSMRSGSVCTMHYSFYANTSIPTDVDRDGFEEIEPPKKIGLEEPEDVTEWEYPGAGNEAIEDTDDDETSDEEDEIMIEPTMTGEPERIAPAPEPIEPEPPVPKENPIAVLPAPEPKVEKAKRKRLPKGVASNKPQNGVGNLVNSWRKPKQSVDAQKPVLKIIPSIVKKCTLYITDKLDELAEDSATTQSTRFGEILSDCIDNDGDGTYCWLFHELTGTSLTEGGRMEWALLCNAMALKPKIVTMLQMLTKSRTPEHMFTALNAIATIGHLPTSVKIAGLPPMPKLARPRMIPEWTAILKTKNGGGYPGVTVINTADEAVNISKLPDSDDPASVVALTNLTHCMAAMNPRRLMLAMNDDLPGGLEDVKAFRTWSVGVYGEMIPQSRVPQDGRLVKSVQRQCAEEGRDK